MPSTFFFSAIIRLVMEFLFIMLIAEETKVFLLTKIGLILIIFVTLASKRSDLRDLLRSPSVTMPLIFFLISTIIAHQYFFSVMTITASNTLELIDTKGASIFIISLIVLRFLPILPPG